MKRGFSLSVLWSLRILVGIQVVLGLAIWFFQTYSVLPIHILNGFVITLLVLAASVMGIVNRRGWLLVTLGFATAVALPVFGFAHPGLLVGELHWIIQILHLALGVFALVIATRLVRPEEQGYADGSAITGDRGASGASRSPR